MSSPPVVVYGSPYLMDIGAMDVVEMIGIRVRGPPGRIPPARSAGSGAPPHTPLPDDPVDGGPARGVEQLVEDPVAEILGKLLTTVASVVALVRSAPAPHVQAVGIVVAHGPSARRVQIRWVIPVGVDVGLPGVAPLERDHPLPDFGHPVKVRRMVCLVRHDASLPHRFFGSAGVPHKGVRAHWQTARLVAPSKIGASRVRRRRSPVGLAFSLPLQPSIHNAQSDWNTGE